MKMRILLMLTALSLTIGGSASASPLLYFSNMSGDFFGPDVVTPARGFSTLWLDDETNQATVSMLADGLTSEQTGAAIYGPAVGGTFANGFLDLPLGNFNNQVFTLTSEQVNWIKNNLAYVAITTASNPAGEIGGQYGAAVPEPATLALVFSGLGAALLFRRLRRR
jgi:hypothetical protein